MGRAQIDEIIADLNSHLEQSGKTPLESVAQPDGHAEVCAAAHEKIVGGIWELHTLWATTFDDMEVLNTAGKDGWELTGVGVTGFYCRRHSDQEKITSWEYSRRVGFNRNALVAEMAADHWEPCGDWIPFHYFKRAVTGQ